MVSKTFPFSSSTGWSSLCLICTPVFTLAMYAHGHPGRGVCTPCSGTERINLSRKCTCFFNNIFCMWAKEEIVCALCLWVFWTLGCVCKLVCAYVQKQSLAWMTGTRYFFLLFRVSAILPRIAQIVKEGKKTNNCRLNFYTVLTTFEGQPIHLQRRRLYK